MHQGQYPNRVMEEKTMKKYMVTFESLREDGTWKEDYLNNNEKGMPYNEARDIVNDFNFRSNIRNAYITEWVEEEKKMTTKEQERKALEKIEKIIAELGEDSYVATAFKGCIADATDNIKNDWAMSMYDRWQDAESKIEQYKGIRDELVEENKSLKAEAERLNNQIAYDDKKLDEAIRASNTNAEFYMKEQSKTAELQNQIEDQAQTIIELKAKLYDLITAK